jgi:hypothetical protein
MPNVQTMNRNLFHSRLYNVNSYLAFWALMRITNNLFKILESSNLFLLLISVKTCSRLSEMSFRNVEVFYLLFFWLRSKFSSTLEHSWVFLPSPLLSFRFKMGLPLCNSCCCKCSTHIVAWVLSINNCKSF